MTNWLRLNAITAVISMPDDVVVKSIPTPFRFLTNLQKWGNLTSQTGDFSKSVDNTFRNMMTDFPSHRKGLCAPYNFGDTQQSLGV